MANIKLTIQHGNTLYEPPIEEDVKIEWERTGSPGKLTFTTLKVDGLSFQEGDSVCFYYDEKLVFKGYVFTKKRDKEHRISVTCYDQIRYLKNKYTYVFENKTATEIVKALCNDFGLQVGSMDNTNYVIPTIAEENKAALDIVLEVLEETLLNTGNMFVFYDDGGELKLQNCANMLSTTLICEETAENFDYSSSIDDETYNEVVLYYSDKERGIQLYTAHSPSTIKKWGNLRYFEKIDTPTIGQNKADSLLKLYNKKTRELKVTGAFGDITVRGGTMIPTTLNLGDIITNNYLLVQKVTHTFKDNEHTMDLTLEGSWEDYEAEVVSKTIGTLKDKPSSTPSGTNPYSESSLDGNVIDHSKGRYSVLVNCNGIDAYAGTIYLGYTQNGKRYTEEMTTEGVVRSADAGSNVSLTVNPSLAKKGSFVLYGVDDAWNVGYHTGADGKKFAMLICNNIKAPLEVGIKWIPNENRTFSS